jgi:hypothetical protein
MCVLVIPYMYAQNGEHTGTGFFTKTVEFNRWFSRENDNYNMNNKNNNKNSLFSDFNAMVEFVFSPSFPGYTDDTYSINGGFRIFRDSLDKSYVFEIKSKEGKNLTLFTSDQFAEKIHSKMSSMIQNFKATVGAVKPEGNGVTSHVMVLDGDHSTFRTVVDVEIWSLKIHEPSGHAQKMSDLCRKIMHEALKNNKLDENNYIKLLDDFNF